MDVTVYVVQTAAVLHLSVWFRAGSSLHLAVGLFFTAPTRVNAACPQAVSMVKLYRTVRVKSIA